MITQGVLTVVDRKFGNNAESEGSIISLTPLEDKSKAQLLVVSFPQGAHVFLDDQDIGSTPLVFNDPTESDHDLKLGKDGYNEKEIRIRTPLGYKLTIEAYLSASITSPTPIASAAAFSPTPTPQVVILNTPTGFLRVHQTSSLSSPEVGQVMPGKTYMLDKEENDWYEITIDNGVIGWISSQYAQKK